MAGGGCVTLSADLVARSMPRRPRMTHDAVTHTSPRPPRQTIPMTNTNASASASTSAGNNPSLQQPFHQFRPSAPRPMHTGASTNTTTNPKDWPQAVRYVWD